MPLWLALLVLAASCAAPLEKQILGIYQAELDMSGVSEAEKTAVSKLKEEVDKTTLEIQPEGKAKVSFGERSQDATWELKEKKLSVTPKDGGEAMTLDASNPSELKFEITERLKDEAKGATITFKKK
jgi:hypothetical protein